MEAEALPNRDDKVQSIGGVHEEPAPKQDVLHKVPFMGDLEKPSMEPLSIPSASSTRKEEDHDHDHEQEQRIKRAKVEVRQVREENERLKTRLDKMIKDYDNLKRQYHEITTSNKSKQTTTPSTINDGDDNNNNNTDEAEETDDNDMVSLTLGRFSKHDQQSKKKQADHVDHNNDHKMLEVKQDHFLGSSLEVVGHVEGINSNIKTPSSVEHSPTDSDQQANKDPVEAGDTWPPSKALKGLPPSTGDDDASLQNPPKKTRVCVRARCDTPTMNDGCQWRKYGQKIAKGNPCPRAYYRCTGAPSCPVRKQVQRSVDDISILITTYEGTHNHPLPVSAMAMASTTSAAASMLLSGPSSSTSRPGLNPLPIGATTAGNNNLHGMNLYLSNNTNSKQFYLQNSSMLSSSLNHPTITLDLTSNPPSTSSSSSSSSSPNFHLKIPSTNHYSPKYPFLDFASNNNSQPNFMSWNNNNNSGYANNNNTPFHNINKNTIGLLPLDLPKQHHPLLPSNILQQFSKPSTPTPPPLPDTIAAATKAITSDPSFQSALAAALSSIMGGGTGQAPMGSYVQEPQGSNMGFQAPSLTCSTSKSPSSSPGDSRDNNTK